MRVVWTGLFLVGLPLTVACGGTERSRHGQLPEPEVGAFDPAPSEEAAESSTAPAAGGLSGPFAALGSSCAHRDGGPPVVLEGQRCGPNGRIAAVYASAYGFGHRSAGASLLHERHANDTKRAGIDVYWDSGVVWLRVLECGSCATLAGWTFVGVPETMGEEHLDELIRKVGLAQNTPLRSRADWEQANWATAFQALVGGSAKAKPAPPPPEASPKAEGPKAKGKAGTSTATKATDGEGTYD